MTKQVNEDEIKLKVSKAKTNLILDHPFLGTIALNMPMEITRDIPTAATNGKKVMYNPEFVDKLTDEQVLFLVAHEVMHPVFEHPFRRMGRDPKKWNIAADYVINQLLDDEGVGKFIEGGCLNKAIYDSGGGTTDGIYAILPECDSGEGGGGEGGGNSIFDPYADGIGQDLMDGEGTAAEIEQQAGEWKVKVAQAAQAAKMMGKLSANMGRFVDEILNPKVDWREVLQRFVEKCKTDERSFARPNRRFIQQGLYLPTKTGEQLGELAFAVDCSGSIGQDELNQFSAEVCTVQQDGNPVKIHVIYFDSEVCHYDMFDRDNEVKIEPHGGGGTAFSPVFKYMDEHNINPVATVFLTDLYCSDYGEDPGHPVLWVSTHDHSDGGSYGDVPFGEVVYM